MWRDLEAFSTVTVEHVPAAMERKVVGYQLRGGEVPKIEPATKHPLGV